MGIVKPASPPGNGPLIVLQGISKAYGDRRGHQVTAVEDFNLEVRRGEFVCIVGSSGCGKTTVINMVAGFVKPSTGSIRLHGDDIRGVDPRCGMLFQQYALFPWLTVLGNVEFGLKMRGMPAAERHQVARRYLKLVGLEKFEHHWPSQLSGGMKQRVSLARVLANDPEILLMDEPFAALDAMTRQVLQDELLRIVEANHKTTLFITHSIDEALILSDRVIVMSARPGRVKRIVENDLPRPRRAEVQLSKRYLELKTLIWESVQEEVVAGLALGSESLA